MMKSWCPNGKSCYDPRRDCHYDRSWYSRALLQPVMGWCSQRQYKNFMRDVMDWEHDQQLRWSRYGCRLMNRTAQLLARRKMTHCVMEIQPE